MTAVLITGMSGTGKSTVIEIIRQRGFSVVETDEPGWCVPENGDWSAPDSEWIWDTDRIRHLLETHRGSHLFVDGCRSNQGEMYPAFDHIVLLTAPLEVMLDRVTNRTSNPFGSLQEQREKIARDKQEFEPLLIQGADFVINTSAKSPFQVADFLITLL